MQPEKPTSLLNNSRFYILLTSVLISGLVASLLWLQLGGREAYYIRLEEIFGLFSVLYWYAALIISPIGYVIGKQRIKHIEFARRAIGVSAAYFASLHVAVALWGQLGGPSGFDYLPSLFKWSIAGGSVALFILLIMAFTSFDKVVVYMTFRRWKWLHRLVYLGGILAVLHIWTIGTHLASSILQLVAFALLVLLAGLESFRVITLLARKRSEFKSTDYFIATFIGLWAFWVTLILIIPSVISNYHGTHHTAHHHHEGDHS